MRQKENIKVLCIGLDGATWDLMLPWTQEDKLPNISRLVKDGIWGNLDSVIPTHSIAAWTSFLTGKNPGAHGHIDFVTREENRRAIKYVNNYKTIAGITLPKLLSDHDKKVGLINVPVTYPPEKVNGFIVPGMLTPTHSKQSPTYPPELYQDLLEQFGNFSFEFKGRKLERGKQSEKAFLSGLYKFTEGIINASKYLINTYEWDFFMVVFTGIDRIQHFFWHFMDKDHPDYTEKEAKQYGQEILRYYQMIDTAIGKLIQQIESNTRIILMSDHGFGPLVKRVNINSLLMDLGLLKLKDTSIKGNLLKFHNLVPILKKLDFLKLRKRLLPENIRGNLAGNKYFFDNKIDWKKTQVYSGSVDEQGIYINREHEGMTSKQYEDLRFLIAEKLCEIRDPDNQDKVIKRVWKKEEVLSGSYLNKVPDLLIEFNEGYESFESLGNELFLTDLRRTGIHKKDGIFVCKGPNVLSGKELQGAKIIDVMPTILYMLGVPFPENLDGKVLNIFEPEFLENNPVHYLKISPSDKSEGEQQGLTNDEEKEVIERLKNLGYLD